MVMHVFQPSLFVHSLLLCGKMTIKADFNKEMRNKQNAQSIINGIFEFWKINTRTKCLKLIKSTNFSCHKIWSWSNINRFICSHVWETQSDVSEYEQYTQRKKSWLNSHTQLNKFDRDRNTRTHVRDCGERVKSE